jgi:hypothetical protein
MRFTLILLLTLLSLALAAQPEHLYPSLNRDSITPTIVELDPFVLVETRSMDPDERRQFLRTRYYVNRVMPFAREALALMAQTDAELEELKRRRHKKKYLRSEYRDIKVLHKDRMKDMYVEEGRILVKIMERETGMTMYEIVQKYRNTPDAVFWNSLANMYGYSLKEGYDPKKERILESILQAMEKPEPEMPATSQQVQP